MDDNVSGFLKLLVFQMLLGQFKEVVHLPRDVKHAHYAFDKVCSDVTETLDNILSVQRFVSDLSTLFQIFDVL